MNSAPLMNMLTMINRSMEKQPKRTYIWNGPKREQSVSLLGWIMFGVFIALLLIDFGFLIFNTIFY